MRYSISAGVFAFGVILLAATASEAKAHGEKTNIAVQDDKAVLSFSVREEVRSAPDYATVGAGVITTAKTAVEALRTNSVAMQSLISAAKNEGIEAKNIQTRGVNLSPQYDHSLPREGKPPLLIGYRARNTVRVTTANIVGLGALIDVLVAAGGNDIDGPYLGIADIDALLASARAAIVEKANEKANDYARLAGFRAARLISLTEDGSHGQSMRASMMFSKSRSSEQMDVPIEPGQRNYILNVNVKYHLVK